MQLHLLVALTLTRSATALQAPAGGARAATVPRAVKLGVKPTAPIFSDVCITTGSVCDRASFVGLLAGGGTALIAPAPALAVQMGPPGDKKKKGKDAAEAKVSKPKPLSKEAAEKAAAIEQQQYLDDVQNAGKAAAAEAEEKAAAIVKAAEEARLAEIKRKKEAAARAKQDVIDARKKEGRFNVNKPSPVEVWKNIGKYYYDGIWNDKPPPQKVSAPPPEKEKKKK